MQAEKRSRQAQADEQGTAQRLHDGAAIAAVETLLAGGGIGEQLLSIATLRRESHIDLSDAEIKDVICEAIEEHWPAEDTLTRLIEIDAGSDGIRGADARVR